ncbi:MAG TPA: SAM-dependent chlorinase/fluorinase [Actinophytocola sp.]|uniref:SAM hydrolase/SAM-dependent halogenase family protein n=1 Tax=Actinophytocola sp. TaxID=1872138 RepID=UPI002DDD44A8|nr:SAM-dependent chlorinase/fluorinase [Actinophytocola sp.]HEV2783416.1 SAM-dependent chlorinase/fluorinase [Actinophytocola sp.]
MTYDWISFTTDYGLDDGFVAACAGVIARIAPAVRVLHVTHTIPPQDIRRAAHVLAQTAPYLPPAVHLAVVDPGVGTTRRPLVIVTPNALLVGPDNGLLVPAAEALGGIDTAHQLTDPAYRLPDVSATFHGRDIFAPAAAHLAAGIRPAQLGPAVDPATLVRLPDQGTLVHQGKLSTEVLTADRFGNLQLAARRSHLDAIGAAPGSSIRIEFGDDHTAKATVTRTFADTPPGTMATFVDSAGHVAIAVNGGSAAATLGLAPGALVTLCPASWPARSGT